MAAAFPPQSWFPTSDHCSSPGKRRKRTSSSPYHLIAAAAAVRVGGFVRLRCSSHLHLLLSLHSDKRGIRHKSSKGNSGRLWTNAIIALNILVYAAQFATQGKLTLLGAKVNSLIDKGQLWRLATSSLLHANIGHLMVNCYSLNSIGPAMEQLSGPRRFIAIYSTSAIASSLMSYCFCESPAVGASGAIFVLVGSYAVFVIRHRSLFGGGKHDLQQIARVIALNTVMELLTRGIDNWGHLGGLLGGAAMSWFLGPAWKHESRCFDGGSFFVDRAPIFQLIDRKRS